jgi:hypothetical protein
MDPVRAAALDPVPAAALESDTAQVLAPGAVVALVGACLE